MTYKQKKCNRIDFVMAREAEIEMGKAENELQLNNRGYVGAVSTFR